MKKVGGVLAWHPEVAMTQEEIDDFLSGRWVVRLATLARDGYPHVTPLWYYWDGKCPYLALTRNRLACKHLNRDPRCSAAIDMDDRPLMGMRTNMAKAVVIKGKAEMTEFGSGKIVRIEAGPWQGEQTPEHLLGLLGNRYSLSARDGALGFSHESFGEIFARPEGRDSQLFKDNEGRVITKITPKKIQAWDFSKAPMGYVE